MMDNYLFQPVALLDKIMIVSGVSAQDQQELLAGFRTLVRNLITEQVLDGAADVKEIRADLTAFVNGQIQEDQLITTLQKFSPKIRAGLTPEKRKTIIDLALLSAFLDTINILMETSSEENKEKIELILDQDLAFSKIFQDWKQAAQIASV